jgi:hypothetical protein
VTDTSSGSPSVPITAETFTITYPSDDSVTLDLLANNDEATSSLTGDYPGTAALILAAINAQVGNTGVTASYNQQNQNIITLSGSGFSVAATTIKEHILSIWSKKPYH